MTRLDPAGDRPHILSLWKSSIGPAFPLDARLLDQQLDLERDESFLIGLRERAGGPLSGAALVKRATRPGPEGIRPSHGNLSFIMVSPEARRRGIGSALLEEARGWLKGSSATILHIGRDRYHFFPGAPLDDSPGSSALAAFLAARGFTAGNDAWDLVADLRDLDFPILAKRAPIPEGYALRFYDPSFHPALESFFRANFPGRWYDDTMEALEAGMRPQDLVLLVDGSAGSPGRVGGESGAPVAADCRNGTVIGFARIYDTDSPVLGPGVYWREAMRSDDGVLAPGGLGPIGVAGSRRGLGLGIGLLRASLEVLAGRGIRKVMIDWTDLPEFYGKIGFRIWKRYRMWSSVI